MFADMTTGTWVLLILSILVGHVALFILARYLNIVALLAASFIMLALLGFATTRGDVTAIRLARIYCAIVALLLGLRAVRIPEIRAPGLLYLGFVILYVVSSLWSEAPVDALARKAIYAMPMVLGLFLGYAIRDRRDFEGTIRLLIIPGVVFAAMFLSHIAGGPVGGRLELLGTNANQAGAFSAAMAILCAYTALYGRSKIWRIVSYATATILAMAILYTGSRGAAGYAIIGCFTLVLPLARRPLAIALLAIALLGTGWFVQGKVHTEATERMTGLKLTGRDRLWFDGVSHIKESPLFGSGWVPAGKSRTGVADTRNWHSMWIQTGVDTGLVGAAILLTVLTTAGFYGLRTWRLLGRAGGFQPPLFLAGALFGGALAHGIVESNALIGSSISSLLLPLSIVLLERLPIILQAERPEEEEAFYEEYGEDVAYAGYDHDYATGSDAAEGVY